MIYFFHYVKDKKHSIQTDEFILRNIFPSCYRLGNVVNYFLKRYYGHTTLL